MKKKIPILILFLIIAKIICAQENKRLIQVTGRIFDDFLQPLPYSHILVLNDNRGAIADNEGKFSFVALENDTLMISSLGFKKSIIIVPDSLEKPFFTRDVLLERDTFLIEEVKVYPWKNYDEFKEAFLNLELPDDDLERARKNIALIKTQLILDDTPYPSENFKRVMEEQYQETFTRGTYPTYQIFNAFAWAKFIKALKNGDFKQE